jgi:hypothetical protein
MVKVMYINLSERTDKNEKVLKNLIDKGFLNEQIERIDAVKVNDLGTLGCVKSHIVALTNHMIFGKEEYLLILEDDFRFTINYSKFHLYLKGLIDNLTDFDVWQISATDPIFLKLSDNIELNNIYKIIKANSTAAYLVKKSYIPKLLKYFIDSFERLNLNKETITKIYNSYYNCDYNHIPEYIKKSAGLLVMSTHLDNIWSGGQLINTFVAIGKEIGEIENLVSDITGKNDDQSSRQFINNLHNCSI